MAKEYIEREAFIEDIKTEITNLHLNGWKGTPIPHDELYSFIDRINEQPTADVVEVVRCKDCKHGVWDEDEQMYKCVYDADYDTACDEYFGFVAYEEADFYCGRGERRDSDAAD